jgi:hypothetical protein
VDQEINTFVEAEMATELKMEWRATDEGWILDGRVLSKKTKRILARATFHLPYDQAEVVENIIGKDAKEGARKVLTDLLNDIASRLAAGEA